jgi:alpha-D-ribose 1-methylphosphonate 5-triphosphate synthase subunit PhnG
MPDQSLETHNRSIKAKARQQWLRTLSCAPPDELDSLLAPMLRTTDTKSTVTESSMITLRKPEVGLALVSGRTGGTGEPFGLGEITVTRCVVQVGTAMGVGYVKGRAAMHAQNVAAADALLQTDRYEEFVREVIVPLDAARQRREHLRATSVETSRVQFLTMVRGE